MFSLELKSDVEETDGQLKFTVMLKHPRVIGAKKNQRANDVVEMPKETLLEKQLTIERAALRASDYERARSGSYSQLYLDLAIFVDQGLWRSYQRKYRSRAESKLNSSFVQGMLDVMGSHYNSLQMPVRIRNTKYLGTSQAQENFIGLTSV